eukprot:CAMPEP_0114977244 /NCGR_PEP_ID=MMETSP0216-20121206/3127_1 /TAXON_ID=223996 /ORGANISM="Protocruzia adherens, Strain Boccale" /LENGTH=192 /DNA_ID=CAMNT_0002338275 /DNA_START=178 /DNA_END=756 /DNA_ORIENTATION=+
MAMFYMAKQTLVDIMIAVLAVCGMVMASVAINNCRQLNIAKACYFYRWKVFCVVFHIILPVVRFALMCSTGDGEDEGDDAGDVNCKTLITPIIAASLIYLHVYGYIIWVVFSFWAHLLMGHRDLVKFGPKMSYRIAAQEVEARRKAIKPEGILNRAPRSSEQVIEGVALFPGERSLHSSESSNGGLNENSSS